MPNGFHLLIYVLAVARVVRLITRDELLRAPRAMVTSWVMSREIDKVNAGKSGAEYRGIRDWEPLGSYLLRCPWCMSIWVTAAAVPLVVLFGSSWWLFGPALVLAGSYVVGFLASHEG